MKRQRLWIFRYAAYDIATGMTDACELCVEATDQPKAEAKADREYRTYYNKGKRLNWARLRRDLQRVETLEEVAA